MNDLERRFRLMQQRLNVVLEESQDLKEQVQRLEDKLQDQGPVPHAGQDNRLVQTTQFSVCVLPEGHIDYSAFSIQVEYRGAHRLLRLQHPGRVPRCTSVGRSPYARVP